LKIQAESLKSQLEQGTHSPAADQGDALAVLLARMNALRLQNASLGQTGETLSPEIQIQLQLNSLAPSENPAGFTPSFSAEANAPRAQTVNYVADVDTLIQLAAQEKTRTQSILEAL